MGHCRLAHRNSCLKYDSKTIHYCYTLCTSTTARHLHYYCTPLLLLHAISTITAPHFYYYTPFSLLLHSTSTTIRHFHYYYTPLLLLHAISTTISLYFHYSTTLYFHYDTPFLLLPHPRHHP